MQDFVGMSEIDRVLALTSPEIQRGYERINLADGLTLVGINNDRKLKEAEGRLFIQRWKIVVLVYLVMTVVFLFSLGWRLLGNSLTLSLVRGGLWGLITFLLLRRGIQKIGRIGDALQQHKQILAEFLKAVEVFKNPSSDISDNVPGGFDEAYIRRRLVGKMVAYFQLKKLYEDILGDEAKSREQKIDGIVDCGQKMRATMLNLNDAINCAREKFGLGIRLGEIEVEAKDQLELATGQHQRV